MGDYNILNTQYNKGLVSVIIPTHNRANIINETIETLLNQTYQKIEIIIIDDNSEDNTEIVIRNYCQKFSNIYYYKNIKKGACAARNLGLNYSQGEYIQFLDDDDWLHEDFVLKRVKVLEENIDVHFATCNMQYQYQKDGNVIKQFRIDNIKHNIETHLIKSSFPAPLYLFKRSTINQIGLWDESCLRLQDIRYYHRLFLHNLKGIWLPDMLYYTRVHNNSISRNNDKKTQKSIINVFDCIRQEWKEKNQLSQKLSNILFYLSINYLKNNKYSNIFFLTQGLKLSIKNFRAAIYYLRYHLFYKKRMDIEQYYLN